MSSPLILLRNSDSAHWYQSDGTPRHDATLREARKEHLYPSVTSILAIKDKPQLTNWKVAQMLAQALTMTRDPGESDEQFIERVKQADAEERAKAPDLGTEVHRQLADYISGAEAHPRVDGVDLGPVLAWIDEHVTKGQDVERRFASLHGFGGCIDYDGFVDSTPAMVDWKTQGVKLDRNGNPAPVFYDEWCWQLSAYDGNPYAEHNLYSVIIDTVQPGCYVKQWTPEDAKRGWKGFLGCKAVWEADRKYSSGVAE